MIIGSTALRYHGIDVGEPKDVDIMVTSRGSLHDRLVVEDTVLVTQEIYNSIYNSTGYVYPQELLTIKMSHMAWDTKWDKTKRHVLLLFGLGYRPDKQLYLQLKQHWQTEYSNKDHLSLAKTKTEFFNDHVTYVYDHDYLHKLVSYPGDPTYRSCLKDGEEVLVCKDSFDSLSYEQQLSMFREEITVIAIERWLVNPVNKGNVSWTKAYSMALKKVVTNLTKNWAADFIILNIGMLYKPDYTYFKHALNVLGVNMKVDLQPFKDILKKLNADTAVNMDRLIFSMADNDLRDFVWEFMDFPEGLEFGDTARLTANTVEEFEYEHLQQEGGGEGGSEYCYGVFKLGDITYRAEYSYYSYHGCEYDGIQETLKEVKPTVKTITVYE